MAFTLKKLDVMNKDWKTLSQITQLEEIEHLSKEKPVVIFKHSTRCGISHHAMERLLDAWNFNQKDIHFYYLDLLNFRSISNEIAHRYNVIHQSPQLIIFKNGKAVADVSHQAVGVKAIEKVL